MTMPENEMDPVDQALFERDALAYKLMEKEEGLSYEDACKKALQIIKEEKQEEAGNEMS